jgi:hypothetical protein
MKHVLAFLMVEAAAFGAAALVHAGVLVRGFEHREATIAESVIAGVLTLGLLISAMRPVSSRTVALAVQAFALLGTCVGVFTMMIGVGPQTSFDVALHAGFVALLIAGLTVVARHPADVTT